MGILDALEEEKDTNVKSFDLFNVNKEIDDEAILYVRDKIKDVALDIRRFIERDYKRDIIIQGSRGNGKTSSIKVLMNEFKSAYPKLATIYINCNELRNSYRIIKYIIQDESKVKTGYDVVYNRFKKLLTNDKKKIMIFDEADLLEDSTLLYSLTRHAVFQNILLIFLTNKKNFYQNLSADVRSSLDYTFYFFDNYNVAQLIEIFTKRAKMGLNKFNPELIARIAKINEAGFNSDARVGIKAIPKILENEADPTISKDELYKILEEEDIKIQNEIILNLTDNKLYLLYLIDLHKQGDIIYNEYCKGWGQVSRTYFKKYIDELFKLGIIAQTKARAGRINTYNYTIIVATENISGLIEEINKRDVLGRMNIRE